MYVIAMYDVGSERCGKMLKLGRRYLHWIQNSVFEGEITEVQLKEMVLEAEKIMQDEDSLILFKSRLKSYTEKQIVGCERADVGQFL